MQSFLSFVSPGTLSLPSPTNAFTKASTAGGAAVTCNLHVFSLQEASCAYVLIVTAVYWVSEAVPLGAAALVPAFLYPLFGVMKSSEVRRLCTFSPFNLLALS